jgi:putative hydrolase of the HAD superfamily
VQAIATDHDKIRSVQHPVVWLFIMDNRLHDASWRVFPMMNAEMTVHIRPHLGVDGDGASRFWQRYDAALLRLMHGHTVRFRAETHRFTTLPRMLRADSRQRAAFAFVHSARYWPIQRVQ